MSEKFSIEIISPDKTVFKHDTTEVIIPSYEGEMGILKDHISIITFLRPGIIKVVSDPERIFFVEEGTVEFTNNNLLILSSTVKELSGLERNSLNSLIAETEAKINDNKVSDREKYFLSYKLETLKNIN